MAEKNYYFRKFLDEIHAKNLRDFDKKAKEDEVILDSSWSIVFDENASSFVVNTARDFPRSL